jgi:hypothetical protein
MRSQVRALSIALGLFCAATAFAQTAAPAAAKASAPAAPAAVAAPAAATPAAKTTAPATAKTAAPAAAAAGGGDGKVWVNNKSKAGEYMTEADVSALSSLLQMDKSFVGFRSRAFSSSSAALRAWAWASSAFKACSSCVKSSATAVTRSRVASRVSAS